MNINQLLNDISIRHARKNVSKYVANLEKTLGIKLALDGSKYEYTYQEVFDTTKKARQKRADILAYIDGQKLFTANRNWQNYDHLFFEFKFHPENAV